MDATGTLLLRLAWRNVVRWPRQAALGAMAWAMSSGALSLLVGAAGCDATRTRTAEETVGLELAVAALLAMTAFAVLNGGRAVVSERRHELGLLAAIGMRSSHVAATIAIESLLPAVAGVLAGTAAASALHRTGSVAAAATCAGTTLPWVAMAVLLAALYPAWRAARIGPTAVAAD